MSSPNFSFLVSEILASIRTVPDQEYKPITTYYILFDKSSIPFYSTSNGYNNVNLIKMDCLVQCLW